jgi:nucleoside-triphosphatase THEP1
MNQAMAFSTSRSAAHRTQDSVGALPLAAVVYDNGRERDALLTRVADTLAAEGFSLGGAVQSNVDRPGRRKCDMYLRDLVSGEQVLISLDRGNEARGCRLDSDAFARVSLWGEQALAVGIDLLVVNKFGKEETEGRGLRSLIAEALIAGIPVILGVSTLNLPDLEAFAGETAQSLAPQCEAILAWCRTAIKSAFAGSCE